jgi:prepilin-type processing-associated H-X9-DG protein
LVELLVVIGIIALLAALLLPVLSKAKSKAQAIACLNNTKQLTLAWTLYAGDNNDQCILNTYKTTTSFPPMQFDGLWVNNTMDATTDPSNTNINLISNGLLFPYVGRAFSTYKCPADKYLSPAQIKAAWTSRTRSYGMNVYLSALPNGGDPADYFPFLDHYRLYQKLGDIQNPANLFLIMDSHPDYWRTLPWVDISPNPNCALWNRLPASYHNGSGVFSFTDGHVELHKWLVAGTKKPITWTVQYPAVLTDQPNVDYLWVAERCTTILIPIPPDYADY